MTVEEFTRKAKELNYTDEQIQDMLDTRAKEKREIGYEMPLESIILIEQPVY